MDDGATKARSKEHESGSLLSGLEQPTQFFEASVNESVQ